MGVVTTLRPLIRYSLTRDDRVPNRYEEYAGLPHYFFAFPSLHLEKLREEYLQKTADGMRWVIDGY